MRSTLWAIWLLGPDPFSDAAKHPSGHLAIGSCPLFMPSTFRDIWLLGPDPFSARRKNQEHPGPVRGEDATVCGRC